MIPEHIKPLLRKTGTFNGTILDIRWTDTVKKNRITPKSSPNKRYYQYLLTNVRMNGSNEILFKRLTIKWIKSDIPFKLKNNNRIEFKGKIMPYIVTNKIYEKEVSYKLTSTTFIRPYNE